MRNRFSPKRSKTVGSSAKIARALTLINYFESAGLHDVRRVSDALDQGIHADTEAARKLDDRVESWEPLTTLHQAYLSAVHVGA